MSLLTFQFTNPVVIGPGQNFLIWVGSFNFFVARVGQYFPTRVKKNIVKSGLKVPGSKAGQPLIYCESKVCLGRVRAPLYYPAHKITSSPTHPFGSMIFRPMPFPPMKFCLRRFAQYAKKTALVGVIRSPAGLGLSVRVTRLG